MKTSVHLAASLILAAIFYPLFQWNVLLILIGGVLIDVDHYLWFIYKYKNISLIDCYRHYIFQLEKNNQKENFGILLIFHTIEFLLITIALAFYFKPVFIFTIGLLSHYALDLIFLYFAVKRFIADNSTIHWIYRNSDSKSLNKRITG